MKFQFSPDFFPNQPPLLALEQVIVGRQSLGRMRGSREGSGEEGILYWSTVARLCVAQMLFSCTVAWSESFTVA